MLDHSCQVQRHALSQRRDDCYETPAVAVEALLRHERLPHRIWEPACGRGAIVNVLRAHDHEVVATDLVDYGIPITAPGYYRIDFLMERCAPEGTQAIVTNPPFKLAEEFVEHALAGRRLGLRAIDIREHRASRRPPAPVTGPSQARRGDTTMDMRKYSGKAFLNVDDVRAGPLRKVIADVREGKFDKPDLEFNDGTRLGVNATNNRTLIASYGTESDDWIDKEIELSLGELKYEGEMTEAVIVKPISPPIEKKAPPPKPKSAGGGDMNDEIPF